MCWQLEITQVTNIQKLLRRPSALMQTNLTTDAFGPRVRTLHASGSSDVYVSTWAASGAPVIAVTAAPSVAPAALAAVVSCGVALRTPLGIKPLVGRTSAAPGQQRAPRLPD